MVWVRITTQVAFLLLYCAAESDRRLRGRINKRRLFMDWDSVRDMRQQPGVIRGGGLGACPPKAWLLRALTG